MAKFGFRQIAVNLRRVVVLVVVLAVVVGGGYYAFRGSPEKTVTGRFPAAVGIYPGTPVKILGVNVGKVTSVEPGGSSVTIKMTYDAEYQLPANVGALQVANSLVSDRYIQLQPVYTGGAVLADGAQIKKGNTAAPAELDDIYSSLNTLSVALGPKGSNNGGALKTLVDVGAANLKGNGAALGNSITQLSKAAKTLADSRGNLFAVVGNLRKFTGALSDSDAQVKRFNEQLAQVTGDLAGERTDLGAALHDLGVALDQVNSFVRDNAGKLHTSITGLEDITNILVKQKASLRETLALAPVALANIVHAYEPSIGAIATRSNLSSLTDPTQLCAVLKSGGLLTGTLLGNLTGQIGKVCSGLLAKVPNLQLPTGLDLTGLLGTLTGGGGLTGSSGLNSDGLPTFPIGGGS